MINFAGKNRVNVPAMMKPIAVESQFENTIVEINNTKKLNFPCNFKVNYHFLRAFGLWPFSLIRDSNGEFQKPKITKIDLLWSLVSILSYISASIGFYMNAKALEMKTTDLKIESIMINVDYMRIVFSLIFVAISIAVDMFNRFKLVNVLNNFVRFDESVSVI